MGPRPPIVERRALARAGYAVRADDRAEMQAIIAALRNVSRDALGHVFDMLHHNRRLAGRLEAVAGRLEPVETRPGRSVPPRVRLAAPDAPQRDPRAIAEGVFANGPRGRETRRTIAGRKGGRVTVVEVGARQMELGL